MPGNSDMTIKIASWVTGSAFTFVLIWFAYKQYRRMRSSKMQQERAIRPAAERHAATQVSANCISTTYSFFLRLTYLR
jgi:hypothetical protein